MRSNERGFSLIEELVALAIMAAAVLMLLGAFSPSSKGVALIRRRVSAETLARSQMEAIKAAPYRSNPAGDPYPAVESTAAYSVTVDVSYWVSPTFEVDPPEADGGLQKVVVSVYALAVPENAMCVLEGYKGDR